MDLRIKNMVCDRCKRVVRATLTELGLTVTAVELGVAHVGNWPDTVPADAVRRALQAEGFALLEDKRQALAEQIKALLLADIHHGDRKPTHQNYSQFLEERLGHDYSYLSALFSEQEGLTIEKYIIVQKIERVKELLTYGELSLKEIAWQLGYSSTQHLSNQFKQVVGQTPGAYRAGSGGRQPLDKLPQRPD